ncbi:hypothetical protein Hdeb2414_s0004g00124941 [Helianthus debilis subsp. tardiflorus]
MSCKCWQRVKFFTCAGVAGPDIWRASGPVDIYNQKLVELAKAGLWRSHAGQEGSSVHLTEQLQSLLECAI